VNAPVSTYVAESSPSASLAEAQITLGVLNAVEGNSVLTQRRLARELGIALGLVNAYLRRCVSKGLIKVTHVPARRYAYYLTPTGFAEKSRLTAQFLTDSLTLFRLAREQCHALLRECERQGWRRMALLGGGDLVAVARICAEDHEATLVGVVDADTAGAGGRIPTVATLAELLPVDAAIVTGLKDAQAAYESALAVLPAERVLPLPILNVSRRRPVATEAGS